MVGIKTERGRPKDVDFDHTFIARFFGINLTLTFPADRMKTQVHLNGGGLPWRSYQGVSARRLYVPNVAPARSEFVR